MPSAAHHLRVLVESSALSSLVESRVLKRSIFIKFRPDKPNEGEEVVAMLTSGEWDIVKREGAVYKNRKGRTISNVRSWFAFPTPQGSGGFEQNTTDPDDSDVKESEEFDRVRAYFPTLFEKRSYPDVDGVSLSKEERPRDYGHCSHAMKDKYGEEKGQKYYDDLINHPKSGSVHFVVAGKINKEKKKMLQDLGLYEGPQSLEKYKYGDIHARWLDKMKEPDDHT